MFNPAQPFAPVMNRVTLIWKGALALLGAAVRAAPSLVATAGLAGSAAYAQTPPAQTPPALVLPPPAAGDLQKAVAALRGISTLRADFVQTGNGGQRVAGVLTMKQPGRIRFQYAPGVPMLILCDGRALTVIDYEVNQVQRWPIGNSPLGALLDPRRDVARFGKLQPTVDPGVISIEVRDRSHPEYGVITLIFERRASAPGGLELAAWVSLDSQNKRTYIRLTNHRYGVAAPDSLFTFLDTRSRPHK